MKNSILATYAAAGKSSNFNGMCLSNGSLFAKGGKYPLMTGVVRVSVGSHYNKIETVDGEYVYTPDWALISYKDQRSIMLDGFRIFSEEVLDIDQSNKVVKGNCLSVANAEGMIIHENLRGFIAVNKNFHLVRYADGGWMFDLFGDMDLISFLYSNKYLDSDHPYHFSHWSEQQFYTN